MDDDDHVAYVGHPCCCKAEGERCGYLEAGYLILPLKDCKAALEVVVGAVDIELQQSSIDLADGVRTRQPLMLPHVSATKCIPHALVSHLGDDVVGQLDCVLDVMDLTLFTK